MKSKDELKALFGDRVWFEAAPKDRMRWDHIKIRRDNGTVAVLGVGFKAEAWKNALSNVNYAGIEQISKLLTQAF